MAETHLTAARLRELLSYDPETGIFTWRVNRRRIRAGSAAGHIYPRGYRCIRVDGRDYKAHRLAWLHIHGMWPVHRIDHIDCIRDDNRIFNLRDVTMSVNNQNRHKAAASSTSSFLGVSFCRTQQKWIASIKASGHTRYLGAFPTPEEAHVVYLAAKLLHHPGYMP